MSRNNIKNIKSIENNESERSDNSENNESNVSEEEENHDNSNRIDGDQSAVGLKSKNNLPLNNNNTENSNNQKKSNIQITNNSSNNNKGKSINAVSDFNDLNKVKKDFSDDEDNEDDENQEEEKKVEVNFEIDSKNNLNNQSNNFEVKNKYIENYENYIDGKSSNEEEEIKVYLPFNCKIIMIVISIINFINGISIFYYSYVMIFLLQNTNYYRSHLINLKPDFSDSKIDEIVLFIDDTKNSHSSRLYNYFIFGIFQILSSYLAFIIRFPSFNWLKDMFIFILYEAFSSISSISCVVIWFLILKVGEEDKIIYLTGFETFVKYLALIFSIFSLAAKVVTFKMTFNDYFDVIDIEKTVI